MPSGPKKRLAARRRSIGARTSLDKESVSGSHASDEGTSPKTFDDVNSGLSLATGSNERSTDQTFQTEEWVRVSDFDVGTPTSTTAKGGFHATAEDSYGDSRGHDKIVDWETISRENADNFFSAEDVGEARDVAASDYGQERGQEMPHVDELLSDSSVSDKEDDAKSVKSRESSHSSSSSSSSSSGSSRSGYSSEAYPKKSDDEERLSSIVVVPSHGEDSQESSFAEVASVETRDDNYHEMIANIGSLEEKGAEDQSSSAIEPASSDDQEEDKYDLFSGVEDQAVDPAPSKDQEKDNNGGSNMKDLEQEQPKEDEKADTEVRKLEHQTPGLPENEDHQVAKSKEFESEISTVNEQVSEPLAPDQNLERESPVEEDEQGIEPTTPDKASEKSFSENPYSFGHSVSDEEVFEEVKVSNLKEIEDPSASLSAHEQTDHAESSSEVHENISKEGHDSPVSSGVPEPEPHKLNQLLEIAHSKEIAKLGKVEQKILAQEHDASNGITDLQPLVEVLSAENYSKRLERDETKDHQADEAPLPRDPPCPVDSGLPIEAGLKDLTSELSTKEVEAGLRGDRFGDKNQSGEIPLTGDSSSADSSLQTQEPLASRDAENEQRLLDDQSEVDSPFPVDSTEPRTAVEGGTLVLPINAAESELPRSSGVLIKDVEASCLVGKIDGTTDAAKCSESSEQVEITPYHKREVQGRPIETSSGRLGCCEPVQWLLANFTRWVNPPAIRN